jgi:hypothetical protein
LQRENQLREKLQRENQLREKKENKLKV